MASNNAKVDIKIEGLEKLVKDMANAGRKIQGKTLGKAARAGAKIALADARLNAPEDTGLLKSALVLRADKSRKRGKKVYSVTYEPKKALHMLVDSNKTKGDNKLIFYPAVQEYGYITKGKKFVPGTHFMKKSLDDNKSEIEAVVIDTLIDELEKEWRG